MNIHISPSSIKGTITAPSSKSITHRAIIIASLANGISRIKNVLLADDTKHTIAACKAMGADIKQQNDTLIIKGTGGMLHAPARTLSFGNSGSTMRMMTAVAAIAQGTTIVTGDERLRERPMHNLLYALRTQGIRVHSVDNNGHPPLEVEGGTLPGGRVKITASVSSQFVSALLLIAPFAQNSMEIIVRGLLHSTPYIQLTIDLMEHFGVNVHNEHFETITVAEGQRYQAADYTVEGDFSSASYFFAAAAVGGGRITVQGLDPNSSQGDKYLLTVLEKMGCTVEKTAHAITVERKRKLSAISCNLSDYPDIAQTLAVVAAYANGTTHITNIGHLTHKESDRIEDTARELRKIGVAIKTTKKSLTITGAKVKGGTVHTHNDHRMAMSLAVAGLGSRNGVTIEHAEVVSKSYPNFWEDLALTGAVLEIRNL